MAVIAMTREMATRGSEVAAGLAERRDFPLFIMRSSSTRSPSVSACPKARCIDSSRARRRCSSGGSSTANEFALHGSGNPGACRQGQRAYQGLGRHLSPEVCPARRLCTRLCADALPGRDLDGAVGPQGRCHCPARDPEKRCRSQRHNATTLWDRLERPLALRDRPEYRPRTDRRMRRAHRSLDAVPGISGNRALPRGSHG